MVIFYYFHRLCAWSPKDGPIDLLFPEDDLPFTHSAQAGVRKYR